MFNISNKTIDSELQIENEFNNYFVSIRPKLASHQTPTTLNPFNSLQFNANSVVIHHIISLSGGTSILFNTCKRLRFQSR